jgi:predicted O-methyltransferase YrrM
MIMELRRYFRLRPYIGMYRRLDITPVQTARGWRDDGTLRERIPALDEYEAMASVSREKFAADHSRYVDAVSNDVMAASIELCAFMDVFCQIGAPQRVVDLGSGFSSYVFRSYAKNAETPCEVHSVDDHAGWLGKTVEYLEGHGLEADRLWHWPDFISQIEPGSFDVVLHDMGSMEFRAESLSQVLTLAKSGGHVILDDVHKPAYRKHVHQVLESEGLEYLSLKKITGDSKARFAYLVFQK